MKEIKDYLPLYLGSPVMSLEGGTMRYTLASIDIKGNTLFYDGFGNQIWLAKWKLLLRPLSDMTEEEEKEVARLCFNLSDDFIITYRGMGYSVPNLTEAEIHESVKCIKIETFCEHPMIKDWIPTALLQIDYEDVEEPIIIGRFEEQGKVLRDDMIKAPFELSRYLLSKHFDLFGLIREKLAIDKTTLK